MSVRQAEQDARDLLTASWWSTADADSPLPVDPFELARGLGIEVWLMMLPSDQSGKIEMMSAGEATISINATDHANRQRFTCAHEIGHYSQRRRTGSAHFVDYRSTLAGLGVNPEEIYANQFAAALLMPAQLVSRFHQRESLAKLAKRFGTSTQAMSVRLSNLGLA